MTAIKKESKNTS